MPFITDNPNGRSSVLDAALDTNSMFAVETTPVTINGHEVGGKHLYRTDVTGTPILLNSVAESAPEVGYEIVYEIADALFPNSCEKFSLLENGRKVVFTQALDAPIQLDGLGGGDTMQANLMWTAALDGTWATRCFGFAERAFCTNQIPIAWDKHISVKRTRNYEHLLDMRSAILAQAIGGFEEFVQRTRPMRYQALTDRQQNEVITRLMPAPTPKPGQDQVHGKALSTWERRVAAVRYYLAEENDGPAAGTAWAVFNAVQSAETHDFTKSRIQDRQTVKRVEQVRDDRNPLSVRAERILATV